MFNINKVEFDDIKFTSFNGDTITCNYRDLEDVFGEPSVSNGYPEFGYDDEDELPEEKTQCAWYLKTDTDIPFTIYDWKEFFTDVTREPNVKWHVGMDDRNIHANRRGVKEYLKQLGFKLETNRNIY